MAFAIDSLEVIHVVRATPSLRLDMMNLGSYRDPELPACAFAALAQSVVSLEDAQSGASPLLSVSALVA